MKVYGTDLEYLTIAETYTYGPYQLMKVIRYCTY